MESFKAGKKFTIKFELHPFSHPYHVKQQWGPFIQELVKNEPCQV
jgi:hypothetical protein